MTRRLYRNCLIQFVFAYLRFRKEASTFQLQDAPLWIVKVGDVVFIQDSAPRHVFPCGTFDSRPYASSGKNQLPRQTPHTAFKMPPRKRPASPRASDIQGAATALRFIWRYATSLVRSERRPSRHLPKRSLHRKRKRREQFPDQLMGSGIRMQCVGQPMLLDICCPVQG